MRPGCVVVPQVFGQHSAQVVFIDKQRPVEELPAQGTCHPFADCLGSLLVSSTRRPVRGDVGQVDPAGACSMTIRA